MPAGGWRCCMQLFGYLAWLCTWHTQSINRARHILWSEVFHGTLLASSTCQHVGRDCCNSAALCTVRNCSNDSRQQLQVACIAKTAMLVAVLSHGSLRQLTRHIMLKFSSGWSQVGPVTCQVYMMVSYYQADVMGVVEQVGCGWICLYAVLCIISQNIVTSLRMGPLHAA
jgi:hypothetical protein